MSMSCFLWQFLFNFNFCNGISKEVSRIDACLLQVICYRLKEE